MAASLAPSVNVFDDGFARLLPADATLSDARARNFGSVPVLLREVSAAADVGIEEAASSLSTVRPVTLPGKGRALVATRPLRAGDVIFVEPAFAWTPFSPVDDGEFGDGDGGFLPSPSTLAASLLEWPASLSSDAVLGRVAQLEPWAAALAASAATAAGVSSTPSPPSPRSVPLDSFLGQARERNGFEMDFGRAPAGGVLLAYAASLANHSCRPSAAHQSVWLAASRRPAVRFYAVRDMEEGDEVTIDYLASRGAPADQRQESLREQYGFDCACERCTAPWDDTVRFRCAPATTDARRAEASTTTTPSSPPRCTASVPAGAAACPSCREPQVRLPEMFVGRALAELRQLLGDSEACAAMGVDELLGRVAAATGEASRVRIDDSDPKLGAMLIEGVAALMGEDAWPHALALSRRALECERAWSRVVMGRAEGPVAGAGAGAGAAEAAPASAALVNTNILFETAVLACIVGGAAEVEEARALFCEAAREWRARYGAGAPEVNQLLKWGEAPPSPSDARAASRTMVRTMDWALGGHGAAEATLSRWEDPLGVLRGEGGGGLRSDGSGFDVAFDALAQELLKAMTEQAGGMGMPGSGKRG
jgi:hypothetical protein